MLYKKTQKNRTGGFSLVEMLIGAAIFLVISVGIYNAFTSVLKVIAVSRTKIVAMDLANERFELIRNLAFEDVGISGSIPDGVLLHAETFVRSGYTFQATTTIRNVDDPFDGTIGGSPNDLSPADYRLVEIEIGCATCKNFPPIFVNTHVAPKALETTSTNGALFVRVFDANGQPVPDASVHIVNSQPATPIVIDDVTNNSGMLQVVDAPPGVNAYQITVTKGGYTTDRTYTPGAVGNPNPTKPHATVTAQHVTQISFVIDEVSTMNIQSSTLACAPVPSFHFDLMGTKLIGTSPNVLKYSQSLVTDSSGARNLTNMEWDTYPITATDAVYDLIGTNPLFPVSLAQDSVANVKLIVAPKNPSTLLVIVKDTSTGLPLSNTTVRLQGGSYDQTLLTERGFITQTDWSHGAGQATSSDLAQYFSSSNVNVTSPAGEAKLTGSFGVYDSSGVLTSSTFNTGSASNFYQLSWLPASQPAATGANSVKMQIATNNDTTTWNFKGPDGTDTTYYTSGVSTINAVHNNDQYLRYKLFLNTASTTYTPNVSDVSFTFASQCVPPGQTAFTGVPNGSYTLTISHTNYDTQIIPITINSSWKQQEVSLLPS